MSIMLVSLTGCDFLRAVAGRPMDKDIEEKRLAIMRAEDQALQRRLDSIRLVERKHVDDSLAAAAALESLKVSGVMMNGPARIGGISGTELDCRYHIIVGAFRDKVNAEKLLKKVSDKGYESVLITCRSGMTVVGVCPSDDMVTVEKTYRKLVEEPFCPKEAWILINE